MLIQCPVHICQININIYIHIYILKNYFSDHKNKKKEYISSKKDQM